MTKALLTYQPQDTAIASQIYRPLADSLGANNVLKGETKPDSETGLAEVATHEPSDYNIISTTTLTRNNGV